MAGAEEIEIGPAVAETLDQRAVRPRLDRRPTGARRGRNLARQAPVLGPDRLGDERPRPLGGGERLEFGGVALIESLDQPFDAAAAALGEIGSEKHDPAARRGAALGERLLRGGESLPFELAAADRSIEGAGRTHDHARSALARARPIHLDQADQGAGPFGLQRFDQTVESLHGVDPQWYIAPSSFRAEGEAIHGLKGRSSRLWMASSLRSSQ
jgi:hypothetical protein